MTPDADRPVRALLVADDSAAGSVLVRVLQRDADITVVDQCASGSAVIGLIERSGAQIVVLDLQLADRSGQGAVEQIMAQAPRPILVLSAASGSEEAARAAALAAGAVDGFDRPVGWTDDGGSALRRRVRQVSKVHVIRRPRGGSARRSAAPRAPASGRTPVVALAASTGGPSALAIVLGGLSGLRAPVLVVQHLHQEFIGGLLTWMSRASALPVCAAVHGEAARSGQVYLAPAGTHLLLGAGGLLELSALPVSLHRPSANELFQSVADRAGAAAVGVVMTGMGDDGARGLLALHNEGGRTLGQDEASCAVFGMPKAARRIGAVTELRPVGELAAAIHRAVAEVLA